MSKGVMTNLASEFYVASILWRMGFSVTITMGHTKEIDLVVTKDDGSVLTIDVKGVRTGQFLMQKNRDVIKRPNHFLIFVSYGGYFSNATKTPRCFVVPAKDLLKVACDISNPKFHNRWETTTGKLADYENKWELLR